MAKTTAKTKTTAKPKAVKTVDDLVSEIEAKKPNKDASTATGKPAGAKAAPAHVPTAAEKKRMLAELAERFGSTPEQVEAMLSVKQDEPFHNPKAKVDPKLEVEAFDPARDKTVPVRLKSDYWMFEHSHDQWPTPHDNRARAGQLVHLPIGEARRLIDAGKAERADPLPGE